LFLSKTPFSRSLIFPPPPPFLNERGRISSAGQPTIWIMSFNLSIFFERR
jgi:hypothetical protein